MASARGSYEVARTSEDHSDDLTLADEDDLGMAGTRSDDKTRDHRSLEVEEFDFRDDVPAFEAHGDLPSPRWKDLAHRMAWWKSSGLNSPPLTAEETEIRMQLVGDAAASPRWAPAGQQTVSWLVWPLPSYLHGFFVQNAGPEEPRRPTDYLDGLRGVASLFVFFEHYLLKIHGHIVHEGYGYENNWNVFQLPFIRTFYAGSAMVAIFFVISGYVLSQRCIVAMRTHKQDKLHNALTSMTFRRAIRLYAPSLAVSALALACVLLGLMRPQFPQAWTVGKELHNFVRHVNKDLFKFWDWEINFHHWYAPQLWTIPLEFRCSMILFLFILMTARTTVLVRFVMEFVCITYLFYTDRWDVALFLAGMAIAEINIIADERTKRHEARTVLGEPEKEMESQTTRKRWFHINKTHIPLWIMLIFGFYLTGYPDTEAQHTPGYDFLTVVDVEFKFRFWLAQAAILIVFSISFLPRAQAFFSTSIARYLGKISYALYLVHTLMNSTIRVYIWRLFWRALEYHDDEQGETFKFEGGWILGSLLYIPLVLWAADLFWRAVDIPAVKFAKWFEGKCFVAA